MTAPAGYAKAPLLLYLRTAAGGGRAVSAGPGFFFLDPTGDPETGFHLRQVAPVISDGVPIGDPSRRFDLATGHQLGPLRQPADLARHPLQRLRRRRRPGVRQPADREARCCRALRTPRLRGPTSRSDRAPARAVSAPRRSPASGPTRRSSCSRPATTASRPSVAVVTRCPRSLPSPTPVLVPAGLPRPGGHRRGLPVAERRRRRLRVPAQPERQRLRPRRTSISTSTPRPVSICCTSRDSWPPGSTSTSGATSTR